HVRFRRLRGPPRSPLFPYTTLFRSDMVIDVKRNEAVGQFDLFAWLGGEGGDGGGSRFTIDIPDLPEWDKREKLTFERQMLGLYVSDHPDRKSTRLNSSHVKISYAVFCLNK